MGAAVDETQGHRRAHAIAIEDSVNGLRAARAAGIWTVVTPTYWTEGGDFSEAALVLPHLGDPGRAVDGELPDDVLAKVRALPQVQQARPLRF